MAKRLTKEEKQYRTWEKDKELNYIIQCKKCKTTIPLGLTPKWAMCKCSNVIVDEYKTVNKNCILLYQREVVAS